MDEFTGLLISRYLDGDLHPSEARDLEAQLEQSPQLQEELATLRALRASVAALAQREEPPADLDRLMEPLRHGALEEPKVRSWLRWAGMAAAVVLALTVVMEVERRTPGPTLDEQPRTTSRSRSARPTERFSLAPLPTASTPEEEQPLGAADRLLASPIPEREFTGEPPALEVLGPLDTEDKNALEENPQVQAHQEKMAPAPATVDTSSAGVAAATGRSAAPARQPQAAATRMASQAGSAEGEKRTDVGAMSDAATMSFTAGGAGKLFITVGDETFWQTFDPQRRCPPGRHIVRVEIVGGAVVTALPFSGAQSLAPAENCAADLVSGLKIEGVPDGEYRAEVVIDSASSR